MSKLTNSLIIDSHKGPYSVNIYPDLSFLDDFDSHDFYYIIDSSVASLYQTHLSIILSSKRVILVEANEASKSVEQVIPVISSLLSKNIKRQSTLVGIGGGIIQDITCFISSLIFRGINWTFIPTTLLSQSDSCIGSKSSINLLPYKNILGNFNPPTKIYLSPVFLATLPSHDIYSGVGEILKVHIIDSFDSFSRLANDYDSLFYDTCILQSYIYSSLLIKKEYIEIDEFDKGIRNIFNYGHSFGHAIESATSFAIPHGIAVTIGMDLANYISLSLGFIDNKRFSSYHHILKRNYSLFANAPIPLEPFFSSLSKDKKNTSTELCVILPVDHSRIDKFYCKLSNKFKSLCESFLSSISS